MAIPMLDVKKMQEPIKEELSQTVQNVLDSGYFINGPFVEAFENELADYLGVEDAIGVTSGSDALIVALMAFGIGPGDEVITTPFTFFATVGAIARVGATPVFVDICPDSFQIDHEQIESKITSRTKCILPVSLFGQTADMDPIIEIGKKHGLRVLEDAAQSIGAKYKDRFSGSMGDAGTLSFFPAKNLGCLGDGGAVLTQNKELGQQIRKLRNHGGFSLYHYEEIGGNFRLDALQAAVLSTKLPYLKEWEATRRKHASYYDSRFASVDGLTPPVAMPFAYHVYNQYVLRVNATGRPALQEQLKEKGIASAIYYPLCLHQQTCFEYLGYKKGDFPEAEKAADEVLAIPLLTDQYEQVADAVVEAMS